MNACKHINITYWILILILEALDLCTWRDIGWVYMEGHWMGVHGGALDGCTWRGTGWMLINKRYTNHKYIVSFLIVNKMQL